MLVSNGVAVNGRPQARVVWEGTPAQWPAGMHLGRSAGYAEMYAKQLWVAAVVNKLAKATARLPLKVYRRDEDGRPEVPEHPYARLLRAPSSVHDRVFFWVWTVSTYKTFGEAFWLKVRDRGGRPVELVLAHPTAMQDKTDPETGVTTWTFDNGRLRVEGIPSQDVVQFKTYNPDSTVRGLSPLEPLRATLENEDASRRATSAFWRNGGRPSVALRHPGELSDDAGRRLRFQWNEIHAGADNFGKVAILEEGMEAQVLQLSNEDAQYVEGRKLNREEVCGGYDIPPPVVHILDRATFSNITEQMRSLYRDTMPPDLNYYEAVLETQLRASVRKGATEPDFGAGVYAEFLLDEVLRGDFEARLAALKNADHLMVSEKRRIENLPFVKGTDRLFVNAATIPLDAAAYAAVGGLVRAGFDPAAALEALGLPEIEHTGLVPVTVQSEDPPPLAASTGRTLMGRLSWQTTAAEVDAAALTDDLAAEEALMVRAALAASADAGEDIRALRSRLRRLETA